MQGVTGSIPVVSTKNPVHFGEWDFYLLLLTSSLLLKAERVSVPNGGAPPEPLAVSYAALPRILIRVNAEKQKENAKHFSAIYRAFRGYNRGEAA